MSENRVGIQDSQPLVQIALPVYVFQKVSKLSNEALRVYLSLTWLSKTSKGQASLQEIATVAGVDAEQVDPAVAELQEMGLAKRGSGTAGASAAYFLTKP